MATLFIENYLPAVKYDGLNTNSNVDFSGSSSVALPAGTTIGGSSVVALGNITSSATTGNMFTVSNTGIYTGTGVFLLTADSATTGAIQVISANGLTTGTGFRVTSTGTIVTTGELLDIVGNSATTSTGLVRISGTSLTDGWAIQATSGGANLTSSGGIIDAVMGASTVGTGIRVVSTGIYTGTTGIIAVTANSATTGSVAVISGTGITTGKGLLINGTAATLTTGRYISVNNAATEVFGIGAEGHIHTGQTTAPTIAVTTQNGITAAAITAGSTDTVGAITTTGTSTGSTVITVTFNKTYTTAPKIVMITAANAAGGGINSDPYVSSITATTFVLTIPPSGVYAATPSWYYLTIA